MALVRTARASNSDPFVNMPLPDVSAIQSQLAKAKAKEATCERAWEAQGRNHISDGEIEQVRGQIQELDRRYRELDDRLFKDRSTQVSCQSLRTAFERLLGAGSIEPLPAAMLVGVLPFSLSILLLFAFGVSMAWMFGVSIAVFLLTVGMVGATLHSLDQSEFGDKTDHLKQWVDERRGLVSEAKQNLATARQHLKRLETARSLENRWREAHLRVQESRRSKPAGDTGWRRSTGDHFVAFPSRPFWPTCSESLAIR